MMSTMSSCKIVVSFILSFSLVAVMSLASGRNTLQGHNAANKLDTTATSCLFDFERGEIPNCLRLLAGGDLFIAPHVVRQLHFDSYYGLAPVFSRVNGWMYVSRKGKAVVRDVPTVDNGPDLFHDGLVRVLSHQKYGFANRKGQLVIPLTYDGAINFDNGKAKVCKGCESKCSGADCERHVFAGGEWFQIDTQGTIVGRIQP